MHRSTPPCSTRNPNCTVEDARRPLGGSADDPLIGDRPEWWWAGLPPEHGIGPGVRESGAVASLALPDLSRCSRAEVRDYFANGWMLTEVLLSSLQGEAAFLRPPYHRLRHPMVFYLGHTACFYVNKLRVARLLHAPIDPYFEQLFETGVDEMSWDDMSKNEMAWPEVRDVCRYRRDVFVTVMGLIDAHPGLSDGHPPIDARHPLWALFMACEHERIHLETSSVLLREMPLSLLRRPAPWPALHPSAGASRTAGEPSVGEAAAFTAVAGGEVRLGKPATWPTFGWDNEYGARDAVVSPFRISRHMASNGDFLAFVEAGGYAERRYWTDTGWAWRAFRNVKWPTFWLADGPAGSHLFKLRTLFEIIDLPRSWPVCVNRHEAEAFLAWRSEKDAKSYRLPTEAEYTWLRNPAARGPGGAAAADRDASFDSRATRGDARCNVDLAFGSESPVDGSRASLDGVHDLVGNVWGWCEDDFHPLDGFRVHPLYEDFSAPCFDGDHAMLLGGSFMSTGAEASMFGRFHFRPHFFQHAGLHVVDAPGPGTAAVRSRADRGESKYEAAATLHQYLLLHYGASEDTLPPGLRASGLDAFPRRCADVVVDWTRRLGVRAGAALDVGCGVGGAAFTLAGHFAQVTAVDVSAAFIEAANALKRDGRHDYEVRIEGSLVARRVARVDEALDRARLVFRRADACSLPAEYADFDAVLIANVLCRLPSPKALLARLAGPRGLVKAGGVVVFASPYTWSEQFTSKSAWLGGYEREAAPVRSFDALSEILSPDFELLERKDMPLVIREHERKYEYIVSDASVWRRRA